MLRPEMQLLDAIEGAVAKALGDGYEVVFCSIRVPYVGEQVIIRFGDQILERAIGSSRFHALRGLRTLLLTSMALRRDAAEEAIEMLKAVEASEVSDAR